MMTPKNGIVYILEDFFSCIKREIIYEIPKAPYDTFICYDIPL